MTAETNNIHIRRLQTEIRHILFQPSKFLRVTLVLNTEAMSLKKIIMN